MSSPQTHSVFPTSTAGQAPEVVRGLRPTPRAQDVKKRTWDVGLKGSAKGIHLEVGDSLISTQITKAFNSSRAILRPKTLMF